MKAIKRTSPANEIDKSFANFQNEFIKHINKELVDQYDEGFLAGFNYAKNHDKLIKKLKEQ